MKCFECGSICITKYNVNQVNQVTSIQKTCKCGWESYPMKIPEAL